MMTHNNPEPQSATDNLKLIHAETGNTDFTEVAPLGIRWNSKKKKNRRSSYARIDMLTNRQLTLNKTMHNTSSYYVGGHDKLVSSIRTNNFCQPEDITFLAPGVVKHIKISRSNGR